MYRLLEPDVDIVCETDEFFSCVDYWQSCAGDANCNHTYTKFMLPIRRKLTKEDLDLYTRHYDLLKG